MSLQQSFGVPHHMIGHEGLDEEIAVVIAGLHPELAGLAARHHRLGQRFDAMLFHRLEAAESIDALSPAGANCPAEARCGVDNGQTIAQGIEGVKSVENKLTVKP